MLVDGSGLPRTCDRSGVRPRPARLIVLGCNTPPRDTDTYNSMGYSIPDTLVPLTQCPPPPLRSPLVLCVAGLSTVNTGLPDSMSLAGEGFCLACGCCVGYEDSLGEVGHQVVALGCELRRWSSGCGREG